MPAVVVGELLGNDTMGRPFHLTEDFVEITRLTVVQTGTERDEDTSFIFWRELWASADGTCVNR